MFLDQLEEKMRDCVSVLNTPPWAGGQSPVELVGHRAAVGSRAQVEGESLLQEHRSQNPSTPGARLPWSLCGRLSLA